jgi:hypothetical protein
MQIMRMFHQPACQTRQPQRTRHAAHFALRFLSVDERNARHSAIPSCKNAAGLAAKYIITYKTDSAQYMYVCAQAE